MKKPKPTRHRTGALLVAAFLWQLLATASATAGERMTVFLLDPRVVTHTEETMATGWGKDRTDIIGRRVLSEEETAALRLLLKEELTPSTDVPFCGHSPAYAVQLHRDGKLVSTVTLCGLCSTWAGGRSRDLKVLGGTKSLEFLQRVLPLPPAFQDVKALPNLYKLGKEPFYKLKASRGGDAEGAEP